jgi:hypothetical protein
VTQRAKTAIVSRHREPELSDVDRQALELALEFGRKDPRRREQLDLMLQRQSWIEVAQFASYGQQCRSLNLRPWQSPPAWAELGDQDDAAGPIFGRRAAAELLARMLALRISRWHPDPIAAIEQAEAARQS